MQIYVTSNKSKLTTVYIRKAKHLFSNHNDQFSFLRLLILQLKCHATFHRMYFDKCLHNKIYSCYVVIDFIIN